MNFLVTRIGANPPAWASSSPEDAIIGPLPAEECAPCEVLDDDDETTTLYEEAKAALSTGCPRCYGAGCYNCLGAM